MGLGRQVHFSQRITMVMNMMTPPEALNTRVVESVLKIVCWVGEWNSREWEGIWELEGVAHRRMDVG